MRCPLRYDNVHVLFPRACHVPVRRTGVLEPLRRTDPNGSRKMNFADYDPGNMLTRRPDAYSGTADASKIAV
jgi:hypothetical protein